MDNAEDGEEPAGPGPMETLLCALAACTAMDVISILKKKRQKVTAYRVEVSGERPPSGQWPRPFLSFGIHHVLEGEGLDPAAIERAIELSHTKYCSVSQTLQLNPEIKNTWQAN